MRGAALLLLGILGIPAVGRAQAVWRPVARVEVGALDPDDPFLTRMSFGATLALLHGSNLIGLRGTIQSSGPNYGAALGHDARHFALLTAEHYFQPDDRLRRQFFFRLGAGAVFQTQIKTQAALEAGVGIRYLLTRRFDLLGSLGDAIVFEQAQSFSCSDGIIVTTCTVPNKAQSNFELTLMVEARL